MYLRFIVEKAKLSLLKKKRKTELFPQNTFYRLSHHFRVLSLNLHRLNIIKVGFVYRNNVIFEATNKQALIAMK